MPEIKREVELISYLANPVVRNVVKNVARRWKFEAPLAGYLQEYYTGLSANYAPSDAELESFLICKNCQEGDISLAALMKNTYESVQAEGTKTLVSGFFHHYRDRAFRVAVDSYNLNAGTDPELAMSEMIKAVAEIHKAGSVGYEIVNYADMDMDKYIEEEMNKPENIIKSKFNLINASTPLGGYQKGWLVQIAAPPGTLKTQFALNETVHMASQGFNIAWIALGDMNKKSMLRRIMCLVNHVNKMDLGLNVKRYWNDRVKEIASHIRFVYKPAYEVPVTSIISIVHAIETPEFPVDVVVVDYDGNFKSSGETMYERQNYIYGELHNVATDGVGTPEEKFRLVFVGCQAKPEWWGKEKLGEACCAESSGKQAKVDLMITGNRNQGNPDIGTLNIPKNRDGDLAETKYHLEKWGGIRGISNEEYVRYLNAAPEPDARLNIVSEAAEA
jgi:hypothetical protein